VRGDENRFLDCSRDIWTLPYTAISESYYVACHTLSSPCLSLLFYWSVCHILWKWWLICERCEMAGKQEEILLIKEKIVVFWIVMPVVLWVNTKVLEEHAVSVFRDEVCRFTNRLGYICKLQGRSSWDPWKMGKGRNPAEASSKKWTKNEGKLWFIILWTSLFSPLFFQFVWL
jgi:hypothetical protein